MSVAPGCLNRDPKKVADASPTHWDVEGTSPDVNRAGFEDLLLGQPVLSGRDNDDGDATVRATTGQLPNVVGSIDAGYAIVADDEVGATMIKPADGAACVSEDIDLDA